MKKICKTTLQFLIGFTGILSAQPGSLDLTFNPQTTSGTFVKACAMQSDGKLIICGSFPKGIVRLNADGSTDAGFITGAGTNTTISSIAIQNDGKILIGGPFTSYNGVNINRIARLNTNGTLDNTFAVGTGVSPSSWDPHTNGVNAIVVQSDGKIIIGGNFSAYNGTAIENLARLHPNGALDATFITGTGVARPVLSMAIQNDQKIIIAGLIWGYNSASIQFIARLHSNGTLDNAFSAWLGPTNVSEIDQVLLQPDGKLLIGGVFNACNGTPAHNLARLNTDGSLDNTFLLDQVPSILQNKVKGIAMQQDGRIIVAGETSSFVSDAVSVIHRLNNNGTPDASFIPLKVTGMPGTDRGIHSVAIQNDGKILIGGNFVAYDNTPRGGVARLNGDNMTGIAGNHMEDNQVLVIPNPSNGNFSIQVKEEMQQATLSIKDLTGREVYCVADTSYSGRKIDISHCSAGIYVVTINNGNKQYRCKLLLK